MQSQQQQQQPHQNQQNPQQGAHSQTARPAGNAPFQPANMANFDAQQQQQQQINMMAAGAHPHPMMQHFHQHMSPGSFPGSTTAGGQGAGNVASMDHLASLMAAQQLYGVPPNVQLAHLAQQHQQQPHMPQMHYAGQRQLNPAGQQPQSQSQPLHQNQPAARPQQPQHPQHQSQVQSPPQAGLIPPHMSPFGHPVAAGAAAGIPPHMPIPTQPQFIQQHGIPMQVAAPLQPAAQQGQQQQQQQGQQQQQQQQPALSMRTVYIGNVRSDTPVESVIDIIRTGPIEFIKQIVERNCIFVTFVYPENAEDFINQTTSTKKVFFVNGNELRFGWGKASPQSPQIVSAVQQGASRAVFLGGINDNITEETIQERLSTFGQIERIRIQRDKNNAFIHFFGIADAIRCVTTLSADASWKDFKVSYGKDRCTFVPKDVYLQQQTTQRKSTAQATLPPPVIPLVPIHLDTGVPTNASSDPTSLAIDTANTSQSPLEQVSSAAAATTTAAVDAFTGEGGLLPPVTNSALKNVHNAGTALPPIPAKNASGAQESTPPPTLPASQPAPSTQTASAQPLPPTSASSAVSSPPVPAVSGLMSPEPTFGFNPAAAGVVSAASPASAAVQYGQGEPGGFLSSIQHPNQPSPLPSYEGNRTVYLGNIHPETTCEELCNAIRGGMLHNIKYLPDKHIAFISFIEPAAAAQLYHIGTYQGIIVRNRRLKIGWGKNTPLPTSVVNAVSQLGATRNVYVGNLDSAIDEAKLTQDFSQFGGDIEFINMLPEKRCGFISFTHIMDAVKAVENMRQHPDYKPYKINFGKDRCANQPRPPKGAASLNNAMSSIVSEQQQDVNVMMPAQDGSIPQQQMPFPADQGATIGGIVDPQQLYLFHQQQQQQHFAQMYGGMAAGGPGMMYSPGAQQQQQQQQQQQPPQ